jgi:hypothetical protein
VVIPPIHDSLLTFIYGIAGVELNRRPGYIDTKHTQYWED